MSPDEILVLVGSAVAACVAWAVWYFAPSRVRGLGRPAAGRPLLLIAPTFAAAVLVAVLLTASAHDVRDDPRYLTLYFLLGMAWVGVAMLTLPMFGVSARDDVVERANGSAASVVAGAMVAIALCYAGGNIGDGPGWWVVVFCAALATAALFIAWFVLDWLSGVSEVVTVDRDPSAGVRLAGFLVACGLVFGRAVAGDWVSMEATVRDFLVTAWPALLLIAAAVIVERVARPTPERPLQPIVVFGVVPAVLYILAAVQQLVTLGLPA